MSPHGTNASAHGRVSLRDELRERTGLETVRCYQCGKCSAGCPMASETTLRPHDVMRLVNFDAKERLLADESIWLCLTCETCTERCPNGCDPARTIDALRELAVAESPGSAPRAALAFHRSFLDQIRLTGRSFELGLVAEYKVRTGQLLKDVTIACIGPVTARTAEGLGMKVRIQPKEYTIPALTAAIVNYFAEK